MRSINNFSGYYKPTVRFGTGESKTLSSLNEETKNKLNSYLIKQWENTRDGEGDKSKFINATVLDKVKKDFGLKSVTQKTLREHFDTFALNLPSPYSSPKLSPVDESLIVEEIEKIFQDPNKQLSKQKISLDNVNNALKKNQKLRDISFSLIQLMNLIKKKKSTIFKKFKHYDMLKKSHSQFENSPFNSLIQQLGMERAKTECFKALMLFAQNIPPLEVKEKNGSLIPLTLLGDWREKVDNNRSDNKMTPAAFWKTHVLPKLEEAATQNEEL